MALIEFDYCVVDTETTGGKADINRLIEIAAFHVRDGVIFVAHNVMFDYRFIQCEFARLAQAFPKKTCHREGTAHA